MTNRQPHHTHADRIEPFATRMELATRLDMTLLTHGDIPPELIHQNEVNDGWIAAAQNILNHWAAHVKPDLGHKASADEIMHYAKQHFAKDFETISTRVRIACKVDKTQVPSNPTDVTQTIFGHMAEIAQKWQNESLISYKNTSDGRGNQKLWGL